MDRRSREEAADELQREIERDLEGEKDPSAARPSLRDLFRERMLPLPPDDLPPDSSDKRDGDA